MKQKGLDLSELQKIYDSEINFSIESFWDAQITVKLGDELNGILEETVVESLIDAVQWLNLVIQIHFPESQYVKNIGVY